jgi:putative ABC transport system permease protein
MLKSILTTALRNITRQASFSFINLTGLSVGMSLALLIITIVRDQYTFDNFHKDRDKIYRVNTMALRVNGGSEPYASTPLPLAKAISDDYTFADKIVRFDRWFRGDASHGNVNVPLKGMMTDASFFEVFNFPLEKGDASTALKDSKSIVLTHAAAEKLFGQADPLGQTITFGDYGEFQVTGVLKPFIEKTHLEFEVLGSLEALPLLEKEGKTEPVTDNWNNYYMTYVYFTLRDGHSIDEAERALPQIAKKYYAGLKLETRDRGYEFYLQRLSDITPGPGLSNQMGNGLPDIILVFMGVLAAVVMVMACFNYTNLMIARSLTRAREIGVRKVMGAQRFQVFLQFIGEATVFSLIALVFSWGLLQALKPAFLQLSVGRSFELSLDEDYGLYFYFLAFSIGVGLIAGLLPAGYLSAFKPIKVLKDSGGQKIYSRLTFRKILVVAQFSLSVLFIIVVLVIYNQVNYVVNKDLGIHHEDILNVRLQGVGYEKFANEMSNIPGVIQVGGVSHQLGTGADRASDYKRNFEDTPFVMRDFIVDNHYLDNLEVRFVTGRNFDPAQEGKTERHVILNERALQEFKLSDPASAIGQVIFVDDSTALTVIGVVQNFHFRPMSYEIGPLALRYKTKDLAFVSARIVPGQKEAVMAHLLARWKRFDAVHELSAQMMSDEIEGNYRNDGFYDMVKVVGYVSFLAITLACLGMLGMAMYSTQTRVKEIGIRKVMGAGSWQVVLVLSRSFLVLIGLAVLIGVPAGYAIGGLFLENFAYKITISFGLITSGVLTIVILGMITIASQTLRAARANPVNSLRYE